MRRKVLHVITGLGDGGAEAVLTRVVANSTRFSHVVISLTDEGKYGSALIESGACVHTLKMLPSRPDPIKFVKLVKLIRSEAPDVVQTWMYHADFLGGLAARVAKVRKVYWGVRQTTLGGVGVGGLTLLIAKMCALLSGVIPDKIICCADTARIAHENFGYDKDRLVVIENGYDLERFCVNVNYRESIRSELGVSGALQLVGMVGRYAPQKNHAMLLRAFAKVARDDPRVFLCLFGVGLDDSNCYLMAEIDSLNLASQIILAGPRTDINAVMNALDIHCLSSLTEGFPNVLAEAMACGTPVVTTDVGDAAKIVGDFGIVCESDNPDSLAEGILELLNEKCFRPLDWEKRKSDSRKHIMEKFSLMTMVDRFESLWLDGLDLI